MCYVLESTNENDVSGGGITKRTRERDNANGEWRAKYGIDDDMELPPRRKETKVKMRKMWGISSEDGDAVVRGLGIWKNNKDNCAH